jgi:hypothetical protein
LILFYWPWHFSRFGSSLFFEIGYFLVTFLYCFVHLDDFVLQFFYFGLELVFVDFFSRDVTIENLLLSFLNFVCHRLFSFSGFRYLNVGHVYPLFYQKRTLHHLPRFLGGDHLQLLHLRHALNLKFGPSPTTSLEVSHFLSRCRSLALLFLHLRYDSSIIHILLIDQFLQ